jgi:hypothetical protein
MVLYERYCKNSKSAVGNNFPFTIIHHVLRVMDGCKYCRRIDCRCCNLTENVCVAA